MGLRLVEVTAGECDRAREAASREERGIESDEAVRPDRRRVVLAQPILTQAERGQRLEVVRIEPDRAAHGGRGTGGVPLLVQREGILVPGRCVQRVERDRPAQRVQRGGATGGIHVLRDLAAGDPDFGACAVVQKGSLRGIHLAGHQALGRNPGQRQPPHERDVEHPGQCGPRQGERRVAGGRLTQQDRSPAEVRLGAPDAVVAAAQVEVVRGRIDRPGRTGRRHPADAESGEQPGGKRVGDVAALRDGPVHARGPHDLAAANETRGQAYDVRRRAHAGREHVLAAVPARARAHQPQRVRCVERGGHIFLERDGEVAVCRVARAVLEGLHHEHGQHWAGARARRRRAVGALGQGGGRTRQAERRDQQRRRP